MSQIKKRYYFYLLPRCLQVLWIPFVVLIPSPCAHSFFWQYTIAIAIQQGKKHEVTRKRCNDMSLKVIQIKWFNYLQVHCVLAKPRNSREIEDIGKSKGKDQEGNKAQMVNVYLLYYRKPNKEVKEVKEDKQDKQERKK